MKILRVLSDPTGTPKAVDIRLNVGEEYQGDQYSDGFDDGYRAGFEKGRNTALQTRGGDTIKESAESDAVSERQQYLPFASPEGEPMRTRME